jgi:hypothetical protein
LFAQLTLWNLQERKLIASKVQFEMRLFLNVTPWKPTSVNVQLRNCILGRSVSRKVQRTKVEFVMVTPSKVELMRRQRVEIRFHTRSWVSSESYPSTLP